MRRLTRILALSAALGLAPAIAHAQLSLPGAEPAPGAAKPADGKASPAKRRPRAPRASVRLSADPATIIGKTLKLNGRDGALVFARGDDKSLKIVKYVLPGEVVSKPSQKCEINIVSQAPIEAAPKGAPDGLPRYGADIPACPLSFDIVDGAVLAPAQNSACVFANADCQASPSGLWGPAASELDAKAVANFRSAADRSIQDSQRRLEERNPDAAASLAREQSDFAASRDDVCQSYDGETRLGFCASRLAQTRAALLAARSGEAAPAARSKPRRHKKKAP